MEYIRCGLLLSMIPESVRLTVYHAGEVCKNG